MYRKTVADVAGPIQKSMAYVAKRKNKNKFSTKTMYNFITNTNFKVNVTNV